MIPVALVILLTAFLTVTQLRNELRIRQALGIPSPQLQEFGYRLQRSEASRRTLEQEVAVLRERVAVMRWRSVEGQEDVLALNAEVERLRAQAGLTSVEGPGVVVEMRDSPRALLPGEDPNNVLVHYTDLQAVVNELWAAGAEAVAINGERFTVGSSIQCVGATILVNRRRVTPPLRIEAIGQPETLDSYLRRSDGQIAYLRAFDFPVSMSRSARLLVPPYRGPIPVASVRIGQ